MALRLAKGYTGGKRGWRNRELWEEWKQTHDDPHMKGAEDSLAASLLCLVQPPRNEGSRMKAKLFLLLEAALVQPRLKKHTVVYNMCLYWSHIQLQNNPWGSWRHGEDASHLPALAWVWGFPINMSKTRNKKVERVEQEWLLTERSVKAFASGQLNDRQSQSNRETIFVLPLLHKECIKGSKRHKLS